VATGLAWMPTGGDILFIEASAMTGKGSLILTGQLGDVMKESARAALSWVRTHVEDLSIAIDFEKTDIHLHVPQGAVSKDGPSAGVSITVALVSLLTGRRVRGDVAMTGEITLRGTVLPVGGIKEKVLAAHRAASSASSSPSGIGRTSSISRRPSGRSWSWSSSRRSTRSWSSRWRRCLSWFRVPDAPGSGSEVTARA
jgi:ATP-dependent Lon protease